jgi:hypothetical protein
MCKCRLEGRKKTISDNCGEAIRRPPPVTLLPPVVATPHPCSTIISGYLKDKVACSERALVEIDVCAIANRMSL